MNREQQKPDQNSLSLALTSALDKLVENDAHLLAVDASERAISHRVGMYLQEHVAPWDVDCEYNRDGIVAKYIRFVQRGPDDDDGNYILPDVIVHRRGSDENILVIEIKKSSNRLSADRDIAKLHGCLREPLSYLYAAFVLIRTDDSIEVPYKLSWVTLDHESGEAS